MSIKSVIACRRHYRVGINRAAALSRSEPAVKSVSGACGYGQCAVCRVICDWFAAVGAGAAVCVKADCVGAGFPCGIYGLGKCNVYSALAAVNRIFIICPAEEGIACSYGNIGWNIHRNRSFEAYCYIGTCGCSTRDCAAVCIKWNFGLQSV